MKTSNIIRLSLTIILIIITLTQCISVISQNAIINTNKNYEWQANNVYYYIHAYSDEVRITNQSVPIICYVKNISLGISFHMLFWPLVIKIKVWNNSGILLDGIDDHFYLIATNFTGIIFHRIGYFAHVWFLYGYCDVLKIQKGY